MARRLIRGQLLFHKSEDAAWLDKGMFRQVLAEAHDVSPELIVHYATNLFILPRSPLSEWRVFDSSHRCYVDWIYYGDESGGAHESEIHEVLGYLRQQFDPSRVDADDDVIYFPQTNQFV